MKLLFIIMLLLPSAWAAGVKVKCYEQRYPDSELKLTTILNLQKRKMIYARVAEDGDVYERGKLKRKIDGKGEEAALCLGDRGDFNWFNFCINDEIVINDTPHGRLVPMFGMMEYDLGIELHCEMHILDFLN